MTDHELRDLRDLLTDAVADVEPGHTLDEIRARTTTRKPRWPYAAGGAMLAVAASFAAFAVLGPDNAPRATDPGSNTSPSPTDPTDSVTEVPTVSAAIYYVGDTPDGPRLYREFTTLPVGKLLSNAVSRAMTGPALDPDYRSAWPTLTDTFLGASLVDGVIRIEVGKEATEVDHDLDAGMAQMAIEQVIYTAQAVTRERLPVQFIYKGNPVAEVLGVPTSEPLANGPVLATLAHVSLTTPTEGLRVDNDDPLVVEGVGNSFEGNIVTWVEDHSGTPVIEQQPTIAGTYEDKLFPYEVALDLTGVSPGHYLVVSSTDDPSGQGRDHTDSRRITVVD